MLSAANHKQHILTKTLVFNGQDVLKEFDQPLDVQHRCFILYCRCFYLPRENQKSQEKLLYAHVFRHNPFLSYRLVDLLLPPLLTMAHFTISSLCLWTGLNIRPFEVDFSLARKDVYLVRFREQKCNMIEECV